jgi:inositol-hexakisphosphate kinase
MKKPCVIDLKMGTREFSDFDSGRKKIQKKILSNITASGTLGFRICGYKVYNAVDSKFTVLGKKKALLLTKKQIEEMLVSFIDNGKEKRINLYKNALTILKELLNLFNNQYMYQFYASSILLIYDGENFENDNIIVKMIDFAHTQKVNLY